MVKKVKNIKRSKYRTKKNKFKKNEKKEGGGLFKSMKRSFGKVFNRTSKTKEEKQIKQTIPFNVQNEEIKQNPETVDFDPSQESRCISINQGSRGFCWLVSTLMLLLSAHKRKVLELHPDVIQFLTRFKKQFDDGVFNDTDACPLISPKGLRDFLNKYIELNAKYEIISLTINVATSKSFNYTENVLPIIQTNRNEYNLFEYLIKFIHFTTGESLEDNNPIEFFQKYDIEEKKGSTFGEDEDSDIHWQSFKIGKTIDFLKSFIKFIVRTAKYDEKKKESDEIYSKLLEQQFNHSNIRINNKHIRVSQETKSVEGGSPSHFFYGLCHYPNSPDYLGISKNYGNSESTVNIFKYLPTYYNDFMPSVFRSTNELFYNFFEISMKYKKNRQFFSEPNEFLKNHISYEEQEIFKIGGRIASAYNLVKNKKRMMIQLDFYPMTNDDESLLKTLENIEYYFNNRNDVLGGYVLTKEHAVAFTYCRNKIKYCNTWGDPCLDKKEISLDLQRFNFDHVVVFLLLPQDYDIIYRKWIESFKKIEKVETLLSNF